MQTVSISSNFRLGRVMTSLTALPRASSNALCPVMVGGSHNSATRPNRGRTAMKIVAALPAVALPPAVASAAAALAPVEASFIAGMALGTLSLAKFVVTGRILGISGIVKGIVGGDQSPWRWAFLGGLLLGGLALGNLVPAAFEILPAAASPLRMVAAGLLVGVGTSLGSGCTSGHGISGNARLCPRSFVSTLTFMAAGAIAAAALHTAAAFSLPPGLIPLTAPAPEFLALARATLAASVALLAIVAALSKALVRGQNLAGNACALSEDPAAVWLERFTDAAVGFLFALGLGASGMLQPTKVAGFLSILGGSFDPTLMAVMGGALLVATPGFQLVARSNVLRHPLCADVFASLPCTALDWKLVGGAALFGAGWGASGICPGPGLVALTTAQVPVVQFVGSMLAGMAVTQAAEKALARGPAKSAA